MMRSLLWKNSVGLCQIITRLNEKGVSPIYVTLDISETPHYVHDHGIFLLEEEAGVAVKTSYLWQENWESLSMVLDLSTLIYMKNH